MQSARPQGPPNVVRGPAEAVVPHRTMQQTPEQCAAKSVTNPFSELTRCSSTPQHRSGGCSSGVSSEQIGRLYGIADRDLAALDHLGIDSAIAVVESALQRRGNLQITDAG